MLFRKVNITILILSILGLFDSGYLSWGKLTRHDIRCLPGLGDCGSVNNSIYSELHGIPVAYLGFAGYLLIILVALFFLKTGKENHFLNFTLLGITLFGVLFSAYLTYIEVAVLFAICIYCVISALLMLAIFELSLYKSLKVLKN